MDQKGIPRCVWRCRCYSNCKYNPSFQNWEESPEWPIRVFTYLNFRGRCVDHTVSWKFVDKFRNSAEFHWTCWHCATVYLDILFAGTQTAEICLSPHDQSFVWYGHNTWSWNLNIHIQSNSLSKKNSAELNLKSLQGKANQLLFHVQ